MKIKEHMLQDTILKAMTITRKENGKKLVSCLRLVS